MVDQSTIHALDLSFKGDRDYLHGTDIIPSLLALTGPVSGLSVQIYRMTSHVLLARPVTTAELAALRKAGSLCVLMSYGRGDGDHAMIAVTEDRSRKVTTSRPYDEAAVVQTASRCGERISQGASQVGSLFERVVALNKRLLNELEGKSDWLFCSLELSRLPDRSVPLDIALTGTVGRGTYKSTIAADGAEVGTIVFARRPANDRH